MNLKQLLVHELDAVLSPIKWTIFRRVTACLNLARLLVACLLLFSVGSTHASTKTEDSPSRSIPSHLSLELHAHLFMKTAMRWAFTGDFADPVQAETYKDGLKSQASPSTVAESGIGLLVVALYAHPLFTWDLRESIRRQVAELHAWLANQPDGSPSSPDPNVSENSRDPSDGRFELALNPAHARRLLASGRRAVVLSLEGAHGILETDADLDEFIDQLGIRIVTLVHFTDDEFGGAALMHGYRLGANPFAFLQNLLNLVFRGISARRGLTSKGQEMIEKLLARGVWPDLSHASDATLSQAVPLMRKKDLPLLFTHTALRRYLPAERALDDRYIPEIAQSGGVIGLMPSEEMLDRAPTGTPAPATSPVETHGQVAQPDQTTTSHCTAGFAQLARQWTDLAVDLPSEAIALGSDFNGAIQHLGPPCGLPGAPELRHIGQSRQAWQTLQAIGAPVAHPRSAAIERFLQGWERIEKRRVQ